MRGGALGDVILVDLQSRHLRPVDCLGSDLVYCGKAADVGTVGVDGRIVVENRRAVHCDLPALFAGAAAAVRRIEGR